MSNSFRYKLFDLYTKEYITTNPQDPESILIEEVNNSLLEKILPEAARDRLSVATIEIGMGGEMIKNNHPDPENNVLLLAKGSRGIYGPAEYRDLLSPYLDLVRDYPYQRYLTNENVSIHSKKLKIWVVDDEQGISGIDGIDSEIAAKILGDSHGKMSLKLATEIGSPENLMQYRLIAANSDQGWFAKGTLSPSLKNTLTKFGLSDRPELKDIDIILPISSLKGISKQNLTPGVHESDLHLTHHERSREAGFALRSVVEKLGGDSLASAIKQQSQEIKELNKVFATRDALNAEFMKFLQPETMLDPNNSELRINFDPDRWEECGNYRYIAFRKDFEGHQQIINSPVFAKDKEKFYAARARKAAQLSFVKAKGGMIFCSSELTNNQICVPNLPDGAKIAAIRSPIIKLQDIALVENKIIDDLKNDAGKIIEGAIICSPQTYEQILFQTRNFILTQTAELTAAKVDTSRLDALNPWQSERYRDVVLSQIEEDERELLTNQLNQWREVYNELVVNYEVASPQLAQIRQNTFTAIIKGDFDGDNIAILPQQHYLAIYAGIVSRINESDSYTAKLDKIKVTGEQELGDLLAEKANPYILGKTANLAENLQSLAVAAERVKQMGDEAQQLDHLKTIAPSFYYMLANPSALEIKAADAKKVLSTYRFYNISSTGEKLVDSKLVERFDAFGLEKALLAINNGQTVEPAVRDRLFATWKDLLLNLTDVVAQQNQIAVDTFKSERPIDKDLIEGLTRRFRPLDDGLKKVLKNNQTYLSETPKLNNALTNRALLVNNVTNNLTDYEASIAKYSQVQGLFPAVEDEFVQQEVARISNEYDKLTSLAFTICSKAQIENGPALIFYDGEGRDYEVTNVLDIEENTVELLRKKLKSGETSIRIEPSDDPDRPHKFRAFYSEAGSWKPLGTLCNACAQKLELDKNVVFDISEANGFRFSSSSVVHLADSYSEQAYRLVDGWRSQIPEVQVDKYAAATFNYLTNTYSQSNRLGLMLRTFGPQLAKQLETLQITQIKVDKMTGIRPEGQFEVAFERDPEIPKITNVVQITENGDRLKLGNISTYSHQFPQGTSAQAVASFIPPSIADLTLELGEQLTVGGMAKSVFTTAGDIFVDEELEMEVAPGPDLSIPILKIGDRSIGTLRDTSAKYLEDAQLLNAGQTIDLSLTTIGNGRSQKIKAVTPNGRVLEIINLRDDFKTARTDEQVTATVAFQTKRNIDQLFVYRQGQRMAVGEFNFGSLGSHRQSLQHLKDNGLYGKLFRAKVNSRVSGINLTVDPDTVVYSQASEEIAKVAKIETAEINADTDYFLQQQQRYQSFGVIRPRDYITEVGEVKSVMSLDVVVDREAAQQFGDSLSNFQQIADGNWDIENEVKKGFAVFSLPVEQLGKVNREMLMDRFKLEQVYDFSGGDLVSVRGYQERLSNSYPDLVNFEGNMPGMEKLFLPQVPGEVEDKFLPVMSQNLLSAIEFKDVLSSAEWSKSLDLSYFDYQWLSKTLNFETGLSQSEITAQAFEGDSLTQLKKLSTGFLNPEGELIYQHIQGATDARFATELKSTLGQVKYDFYIAKAKTLITESKIPVVLHRDGTAKTPTALITKRPPGTIPLPESVDKNLAPPIVIGAGDDLAIALNNPVDHLNPDLAHPVNFDGQTYPSVQHAYSEIVNRDGVPQRQTYPLVKSIMIAKLVQHPDLVEKIQSRGGYKWLYRCSHVLEGNDFWSGEGKDSPLIGILSAGLKEAKVASNTQSKTKNKKVITLKNGRQQQLVAKPKQVEATPLVNPLFKGKPISMNFDLMLGDNFNQLPVNTCFEAMRGHGRSHTTRKFEPFKAYKLKEGDLAIAYRGSKENPTGQVVIKIGKQYSLTAEMVNDIQFQEKWASREKHAASALPKLFAAELKGGKPVWGMTFKPIGDLVDGKVLNFETGKEINLSGLENVSDNQIQTNAATQDLSRSIQHLGTLESNTQAAIIEHLSQMKPSLNVDVSQYAPGRQNFWLGSQWNLKDKNFESSGVWNAELWKLCQQVYPGAEMALITYSGDDSAQGKGINLHRDDTYAAWEARSINLETVSDQKTEWKFQQRYPEMKWVKEQNADAPISDFSLGSGSMIAFNCKNPHAAAPGAGRWSINLWKVSDKCRSAYNKHLASNGLDGGAIDLGKDLAMIPLLPAINLTPESRSLLNAPPQLVEAQPKPKITSELNQGQTIAKDGLLDWVNDESRQLDLKPVEIQSSSVVSQDLLSIKSGIIVQQVNAQKVMGAGLAKAIATKYPDVKQQYLQANLQLGDVQMVTVSDKLQVANVVGQDRYGRERRHTDFNALRQGLLQVKAHAEQLNTPVYIPYGLGSGLAGGATNVEQAATWVEVQKIIADVLPDAVICQQHTAKQEAQANFLVPAQSNSQKVAIISLPNLEMSVTDLGQAQHNLAAAKQQELKSKIDKALPDSDKLKLLDSVKAWVNKSGEQKNTNSLIANFSDHPDSDTLSYRAALIGRETGQKVMIIFIENKNGTDSLCSVNVANHVNVYELRSKLKELNINSFTLIPTPKFTKVVIGDRNGELLPALTKLAKNYDTQLKVTQGTASIVHQRDYDLTIGNFNAKNRGVSRAGDSHRSDQQGGLDNQSNNRVTGNSGGLTASKQKKITSVLKQAVIPKVDSPALMQEKLTLKAIPILRKLLNFSPNKRQFTDGQIVAKYDDSTRILSLVDLNTAKVKLEAKHDGQKWCSNPQCLGGMKDDDILFLKATLIMAETKAASEVNQPEEMSSGYFVDLNAAESEPITANSYVAEEVER